MKSSKNLKQKFEQLIRSFDQFGRPIAFTYKNCSSFKTTFGGIVSLCVGLLILTFLIQEILKVNDRKTTITNSSFLKNQVIDQREMIISQQEFDIGFSVQFLYLPDGNVKSIDQYVELSFQKILISNNKGEYTEEYIDLPFSKCQAGRFNAEKTQTEAFGITNRYSCPINFKTAFQGSYTTQNAQMIQLQVRKCNQTNLTIKNKTLTCASDEEIAKILNYLTLNVLMTNYTSSISNLVGQQNLTYYTITDDSMQIGDSDILGSFITFQLLLDDLVTTTNIELYTLSDAFSNVGGIIGIITIIVQVLISQIQEYLYYQSLIKQQFQITSDLIVKQHRNVRKGKANLKNLKQPSITGLKGHQKVTQLESLISDLKN
ncbi:UNKNOWN [Stylonychia lemnae]|uniref:Uncharacterized protein n=1 Tax=Stylonychia lemnae TaxID=5949 RepID=A0A078B1W3_STYLE|nr:UNKNOWN [Stylonychia lemnae]|eukprot:CDW87313.1 UNKNOWN [Stylonychia lemnae]